MPLESVSGDGEHRADNNNEESSAVNSVSEDAHLSDKGSPPLENVTERQGENADSAAMEARLLAAIEQVRADFAQQFGVMETKNRQNEAMRREIETLRGDVVAKTLRPLIVSVINTHDNLSKIIEHHVDKEVEAASIPVATLVRRLRDVQEDLDLALSENGVNLFSENNVGGPFNGQRQRVIGYAPPKHPEQLGRVAQCARAGFETDAGLIEKERVRIYRGEPAKPAAGEKESAASAIESAKPPMDSARS
jgi:molecular chaperone GrpE (heat shock protein)